LGHALRDAGPHFTTYPGASPARAVVHPDVSDPWRACMCASRMLATGQGDAMKKLAAVLEVFITISVLAYFAYATFVTVYPVA